MQRLPGNEMMADSRLGKGQSNGHSLNPTKNRMSDRERFDAYIAVAFMCRADLSILY